MKSQTQTMKSEKKQTINLKYGASPLNCEHYSRIKSCIEKKGNISLLIFVQKHSVTILVGQLKPSFIPESQLTAVLGNCLFFFNIYSRFEFIFFWDAFLNYCLSRNKKNAFQRLF